VTKRKTTGIELKSTKRDQDGGLSAEGTGFSGFGTAEGESLKHLANTEKAREKVQELGR